MQKLSVWHKQSKTELQISQVTDCLQCYRTVFLNHRHSNVKVSEDIQSHINKQCFMYETLMLYSSSQQLIQQHCQYLDYKVLDGRMTGE
jgi:hypothetical protein